MEKAKRNLIRILNGLNYGEFAEIDLKFNEDVNSGFCTAKEVADFMNSQAISGGFGLKKEDLFYKKEGDHFLVFNEDQKNKIELPKDDENDNKSFDDSIFLISYKKLPIYK